MTPLWSFYMTSNWVTPSSLVIHISAAISLWKAETCSCLLYTLVYALVIQNRGLNQANTETVTNTTIYKITEIIESYTILEVSYDEGAFELLIL